jgi:4-hydroxybenzoate polyprenyltransferase
MKYIIKLLRPQEWIKNGFIFFPIFFNGEFLDWSKLQQCIIAFISFSLTASSIYCYNDVRDVENDRKHPRKSGRPIAAGNISVSKAYCVQAVCLVCALVILCLIDHSARYKAIALVAFYYVMNIAYCRWLKRFSIIDVLIIAIGFAIRLFVGGVVAGIYLSEWIVIMIFLLALFLGFAKRRDDALYLRAEGISLRTNTRSYSVDFLNQVITMIATITIVAYIMYTVSANVEEQFHSKYIYLTSLFVLAGILRYLQIVFIDAKSGNPTRVLLHDLFVQICIVGWLISFFVIIYCL